MKLKAIGAMLIIAGTCLGAGTLALPLVVASAGFYSAIILFTLCWFFMTLSALYLLEVNLAKPLQGHDFIAMSSLTLGKAGKVFALFCYLLLLYSLTAAYIAAGSPWISEVLHGYVSDDNLVPYSAIIFTIILASFIFAGTRYVDLINRLLMFGLILAYLVITIASAGKLNFEFIAHNNLALIVPAIPVITTTFGYHVVIPALSAYLDNDKKVLKKCIIYGSLIPFIVYIIWILTVMGVIPLEGDNSLMHLKTTHATSAELAHAFSTNIKIDFLGNWFRGFSLFVVVTSFLGVAMSLFHFLGDGLENYRLNKKWLIGSLTFIPPLIFAIYYPRGFTYALSFGGIFVALLLGVLPALMAYSGRYNKNIITQRLVPGGKLIILLVILAFLAVVPIELINIYGR